MSFGNASPSLSRSSSKEGRKTPLSLDLSDLPDLIQPSPPSNTLIVTGLQEPEIFHPANLVQFRELINEHARIHTWAPLKSFRRIIVSFFDTDSAISIRQKIDGESLMDCRIRVYYGIDTPLNPSDQHLALPKSDKLFFISPPPSPPHGWEMHNEEAPNKVVHAEDLASALAKLHASHAEAIARDDAMETSPNMTGRRRGDSLYVYHPEDHGDSPDLPAIAVQDTTEDMSPMDAMDGLEGPIAQQQAEGRSVHTARPPVELM